jgi:hypothetical protein
MNPSPLTFAKAANACLVTRVWGDATAASVAIAA